MLHAALGKYKMLKIATNLPSVHHHTPLSGCISAAKAHIDNWKKKLVKQQYFLQMSPQYGEIWSTSG